MRYTYLLINFFTIIVPFITSFISRFDFYKRWRYYLPGLFITAFLFLVWDYFMTLHGVWRFNDRYIIGLKFFGLPIEEVLFFFTVPYSCTFIYECLRLLQSRRLFPDYTRHFIQILSFGLLACSFFVIHLDYTFSVLFTLGLLLPISLLVLDAGRLDRFLQMYIISLLPMFIVNGLLTALPVVLYSDNLNLGIRIGTIPAEDFIYSAILLLTNVVFYEWNMQRAVK